MNIKIKVRSKVRKVGNGELAVVLKRDILSSTNFSEGDKIEIIVTENGQLIIEKAKQEERR